MPKEPPNPWTLGDDPLPEAPERLIAEIKAFAALRRRDAAAHPQGHNCEACRLRDDRVWRGAAA